MNNDLLCMDWVTSYYNNRAVLNLDLYRKWKEAEQSRKQESCGNCPGCSECANMIQIDNRGFVCGALEDARTGESFYVIKDGERTVDYCNCDGEFFVQKPLRLKPKSKRNTRDF